jgi:hypothetical protein
MAHSTKTIATIWRQPTSRNHRPKGIRSALMVAGATVSVSVF